MEVIGGRYELGVVIGRGGMARVVRGRDVRLDRDVAIKLVPIDAADGVDRVARERFVREARSSAGFDHPHAVAVFDAGQDDRYLFLVMELVDGPALSSLIADRGPLGVDESVRITSEVLQALGAAHRAGIVHRDVKPGNVLITSAGAVKLADFGIAKRLDEVSGDLTTTGFVGTPKYLAPEQVMGQPVTGAADLYATGVVLYEMLTGEAPFDSGTPIATAIAHRDQPVPDLRVRLPDVPDRVVDAVTRAMAKNPTERFASADEMRAALVGAPTAVGRPAIAAVAPAAPVPPTMRMAVPVAAPAAPPDELSDRARRAWWIALFALAAIAAGVIAIAAGRDGSDTDDRAGTSSVPQSDASAPATPPATAPPSQSSQPALPPATQPVATPAPSAAPTAPPTTVALTEPPTTQAPVTELAPPPSDLGGLLGVIGTGEALGESGPELIAQLEEVFAESGSDQAEEADKLLDDIDEWVEKGELDLQAADLARGILEPIAAQDGGNSGEGDGGDGNDD